MLQKLEKIKEHNLSKILDDYFYDVCYMYYKRQMRIWVLLQHKYLRASAVSVNDRRFLYQQLSSSMNVVGLVDEPIDEQNVQKAEFPIYFTQLESEPILQMTDSI